MTSGDTGRWGLMQILIRDLDRGERGDRGVSTGVITGVVLVEGSGVLKEKIDAQEERLGEGSPSNSGESLEVVLKLYSGEMFEDDGSDLGDTDDVGDNVYGDGETTLEFLPECTGDFRLIREGDVLFLNSLMAGELQGDMWGERRW